MYLDSKNNESNVSDITVTEDSTSIPISKSPLDTQLARLELIQEENPLMKSVSIVNKPTESGLKQYFNIVDLQGKDHLFFNDVNIDVLAIYDELKAKSRKKVTPNQLIGAINRKIHEVKLEEADKAQENEVKEQNTQENIVRLIPIKDFFRILDLGVKLEGNNKINTSLWYAYFGELMIYEDFLNVELKDILNGFRNYIVALQISDNMALNMNQVEACDRLYELEEKKHDYVIGQGEVEKVETQDKGMQYTYSLKDNAAFVAYVQIFSIVFSVATMLCALLIYVVSK